jgi:ion channel POLLUX/CASTOR
MIKPKLGDQLRYQFDGFISRGTIALLIALITITSLVILGAAATLVLAGLGQAGSAEELTFAEAIWLATTRMLDPGTVADDAGWWYRLVGLMVTVSGVFLSSALVGILVSGLYQRLDGLRQGHTPVIETEHTLILGWSPLVFTLIHELAMAHHSQGSKRQIALPWGKGQRSCCIVILTERNRVEVEEEIRLRVAKVPGTRVICRSGDPLDPDILSMVNPQAARAIIVLSPGGEHPDLPVAKALIALARDRKVDKQRCHVIAALQHPENLETVRLISDPDVQLFSSDRLLAYLTAQVSRQPGLLLVYDALLHFEGTPIQFVDLSALAGACYRDAVDRAEGAAAIGLQSVEGPPHLNPSLDTRIRHGDRLIVVGPVGFRLEETGQTTFELNAAATHNNPPDSEQPGRLLVLGWNRRAPILLKALAQYEPRGSEVTVLADLPPQQMQASCTEVDCRSLRVVFEQGNPYNRPTLEAVCGVVYPHIVILSPTEPPENQYAEVYTMISWLYLREIARKTSQKFTVLREVADVHSRDLASSISPSEGLVKEGLVGLILAQVAQNKELTPVLANLLAPWDARIVLRPARDYVRTRELVEFGTVMAAAQARQETAIGYKLIDETGINAHARGLCLAPRRKEPISFSEEDLIVLLTGGREPQLEERIG